MKSLSGAAEYGKGSAALPLMRRTDRILSHKVLRLVVVAITAAAIGLIAARLVVPTRAATHNSRSLPAPMAVPTPLPTPSPSLGAGYARSALASREYAIGLHELRGLATDAAPGTELEIWVSWDEAFSHGPQVQRLLKKATLSRMIQPVTPEGPVVVVLSVPESSFGDLVYGDLFGSLAVAIPAG